MEENKSFENAPELGSALGFAANDGPRRSVEIDVARYQKYLDDPSLSEGQKEEIIKALWSIMMAFVDLGFGVHPLQEAHGQEDCGKLHGELDDHGDADSNESGLVDQILRGTYNEAGRDT